MKNIERVNVWFGYDLVNFDLSYPLKRKFIYENGRLQKFYNSILIGLESKKQTTYNADLFDFIKNKIYNINIGYKGFILQNLKPCHVDEGEEFGVIYDENGNIEKKIPSKYFDSIISNEWIFNFSEYP